MFRLGTRSPRAGPVSSAPCRIVRETHVQRIDPASYPNPAANSTIARLNASAPLKCTAWAAPSIHTTRPSPGSPRQASPRSRATPPGRARPPPRARAPGRSGAAAEDRARRPGARCGARAGGRRAGRPGPPRAPGAGPRAGTSSRKPQALAEQAVAVGGAGRSGGAPAPPRVPAGSAASCMIVWQESEWPTNVAGGAPSMSTQARSACACWVTESSPSGPFVRPKPGRSGASTR